MRVLHCPTEAAGNAWMLSSAERKLGIESRVMVFQRSWLGYPTDMDLHLENSSKVSRFMKSLAFFLGAIPQYDVFHFNFGSSILCNYPNFPFLDLIDAAILRKLGKKVVVTYQGCDVRQRGFCTKNFAISACASCHKEGCDDKIDHLKEKRTEKFDLYANRIFAVNPDLLHVLPSRAEFLPYTNVDLNQWQPSKTARGKKLVIMHSPTNRAVKGTRYITEAVERLKSDNVDVELRLVENVPHNQVRELYQQADLVIDQLLVGWYGGFAVEVMALAKPVVCYIREEDLKYIPEQMKRDMPIVNANPDNIYEVLKSLVEEREKLQGLGEQSRAYVEKWHDPMKIAVRMKEIYEALIDDRDAGPFFEPGQISW